MVAFNLWGEVDYLQGVNAPNRFLHEVVEPVFCSIHEPLMFAFFRLALQLITQVPGKEEAAEVEVPFLLPHEIIDALACAGKLQVLAGFGFVVSDRMFALFCHFVFNTGCVWEPKSKTVPSLAKKW